MRPSEYSEEQIIEAGSKLEGEGRRVTGFAIRGVLGGGNATRLKNIWDAHKQSQQVVEAEPVHELPVEVQDALETLTGEFITQFKHMVTSLNNKAVSTAERRVSEVIKTAQSEQEKAEAELSDAEVAVEELENQLEAKANELDQKNHDLVEADETSRKQSREITELNKQLAVMTEKVESLTGQLEQEQQENESRQQEINRLLNQVDDLKADKKAELENSTHWKNKAGEYEKRVAELEKSAKEADKLVTDLRSELAEKDKSESLLGSELKQYKTLNADMKKQVDKLQSQLIKIASDKGDKKG